MHTLFVIGLGRGDEKSLQILKDERLSSVRTCIFHSAPPHFEEFLRKKNFRVINLRDALEVDEDQPLKDQCRITAEYIIGVLRADGPSAYFVPGNPWRGEIVVRELSFLLAKEQDSLQILPGEDIWGDLLAFSGDRDGQDNFSGGVTIIDAHSLEEVRDLPKNELIISHPCSRQLISAIKKRLLLFYPPEHDINVLQYDRTGRLFLKESKPLGQIEEAGIFHCWTFFHLAPSPYYSVGDMADLMERLRSPKGCPWDRQQDHLSLRPFLLEEAYEVLDALNRENAQDLCEELGDLFLQVIFHSELAREKGHFTLWQVVDGITRKIFRRHPHVFQNEKVQNAREVRLKWQEIKKREKGQGSEERFKMPKELPALMRAQKVQKRAADLGFDWPDISGAIKKIEEEARELNDAYQAGEKVKIEEEVGDLFFALVNTARFLGVESEIALSGTIDKFISRFKYIEEQVLSQGGNFSDFSLDELDHWWEEAKTLEKQLKP
ncbi:MAG: nucleoside triphosphate pyrophosphohydrolase [Bacillota bacterium]|nr:nucleoside triphosphate pyrophosphohydrolase [Bacillota bacterium]